MNKSPWLLSLLAIFLSIFGLNELSWSSPLDAPVTNARAWLEQETVKLSAQANNIDTKVLRLGLIAYEKALGQGLKIKPYLTIIDFSKASFRRRLWVFDLRTGKQVFNTWVSHGKNSGGVRPTSFSNQVGSLKSSIGVFLTESPYYGGRGYSLRLKGLERGVNDNAYRRSVVVHGAWYVNPDNIRRTGQAGRSWGCPAIGVKLARPLINTIKDHSLLFAYYPDQKWLTHSQFLKG